MWARVVRIYSFTSREVILTCYQHWKVCFSALICFNEQGFPVEINLLWTATVCSLIGRYHCFGETKCLHLQGRILVSIYQTTLWCILEDINLESPQWEPQIHTDSCDYFQDSLYVINYFCNMMLICNVSQRMCHTSMWSGTCLFLIGSVQCVKLNNYLFNML